MKITFITTVNHNVGDDFVREGIKYLLMNSLPTQKFYFTNIHKHSPITSRYGFEFIRNLKWSERLDNKIPLWMTPDRILKSDIVIQSGAPVYWLHKNAKCYNNEWYKPLIKNRFCRKKNGTLLNIAAGSAQEYYSDGSEFLNHQKARDYITEFYNFCEITTVRDHLAKKILGLFNLNAECLPCTSIFSNDQYKIKRGNKGYIVLNYMEGGGHYSFSQKIDNFKWQNRFKEIFNKLSTKEKVVLVCHNKKELFEAQKFTSLSNIFYSRNFIDYINFYSQAKAGILNRVHGAFLLSSFGIPAIIVGSDSRARMGDVMGIQNYFVEEASTDFILKQFYEILENLKIEEEKIYHKKVEAKENYLRLFKNL